MKKYISIFLITVFIFVSSFSTAFAEPQNANKTTNSESDNTEFNLKCKSALLMENDSGKIIYEYNSHEKLPPASVTKVMTMLLTMEAVDNGKVKLNDKVTVSENAKKMGGSTMCLDAGEVRTVEDLLKGIAVESANDAAVALAEYIGGSEEGFVKKMNERAKELGMNDTNFVNVMGFYVPNHYTSAYDVAIMSKELLKHKKILGYTSIWMETISEGRKSPFTLVNRNKMIKRYKGCDGLKTGYVKESKYCISSTAKRGNVRLISIIMGADTWQERNAQAERLLDYGFAKYESMNVLKKGDVLKEIAIPKANPEKVKVVAKDDLSVIMEKGSKKNVEKKVEINKNINLPLHKGDKVGVVKVVEGQEICGNVDLVVNEDVAKCTVGDTIKKVFGRWLILD